MSFLNEGIVCGLEQACCSKYTKSQSGLFDFSEADAFLGPEIFAARGVVGFFCIRRSRYGGADKLDSK